MPFDFFSSKICFGNSDSIVDLFMERNLKVHWSSGETKKGVFLLVKWVFVDHAFSVED